MRANNLEPLARSLRSLELSETAETKDLSDFLTPVEYSGNSTGQGGEIRQNPQSAAGGGFPILVIASWALRYIGGRSAKLLSPMVLQGHTCFLFEPFPYLVGFSLTRNPISFPDFSAGVMS